MHLDTLLVLTYLRENAFIDTAAAVVLLQVSREQARSVLDQHALPKTRFLERRGRTKAATHHLNKAVSGDMHGKAAYTHSKGIASIRFRNLSGGLLRTTDRLPRGNVGSFWDWESLEQHGLRYPDC